MGSPFRSMDEFMSMGFDDLRASLQAPSSSQGPPLGYGKGGMGIRRGHRSGRIFYFVCPPVRAPAANRPAFHFEELCSLQLRELCSLQLRGCAGVHSESAPSSQHECVPSTRWGPTLPALTFWA